jgi:hypothetical protein
MVGRGVPDSGIGVGSAPSEDGGTIHDQIACTDEAARELVSSEVSFPYFFRVRKGCVSFFCTQEGGGRIQEKDQERA